MILYEWRVGIFGNRVVGGSLVLLRLLLSIKSPSLRTSPAHPHDDDTEVKEPALDGELGLASLSAR
jgi:hypothetical protein